jgi:hypothetical protein
LTFPHPGLYWIYGNKDDEDDDDDESDDYQDYDFLDYNAVFFGRKNASRFLPSYTVFSPEDSSRIKPLK